MITTSSIGWDAKKVEGERLAAIKEVEFFLLFILLLITTYRFHTLFLLWSITRRSPDSLLRASLLSMVPTSIPK
jgi:hypothetical protein